MLSSCILAIPMPPVRRRRKSRRACVGPWYSQKLGHNVWTESTLERDFFVLREFDAAVETYGEQPFHIPYKDSEGGDRSYTPDAFTKFIVGSSGVRPPSEITEVKYEAELNEDWAKIEPCVIAGRDYASKQGYVFLVRTEVHIRTPYLENAKRLLGFRTLKIEAERSTAVVDELRDMGASTLKILLDALVSKGHNRSTVWEEILTLISHHRIGAALASAPISASTAIWPAEGII